MALLRLKDIELYYEVHGQGHPILLLSETACDGEVWKIYQVPEFSRDHQVITLDYRGTGQSGKPSTKYTTKVFADDVGALLNHLKVDQTFVIGHSMGGESSPTPCPGLSAKNQKTRISLYWYFLSRDQRPSLQDLQGDD